MSGPGAGRVISAGLDLHVPPLQCEHGVLYTLSCRGGESGGDRVKNIHRLSLKVDRVHFCSRRLPAKSGAFEQHKYLASSSCQ